MNIDAVLDEFSRPAWRTAFGTAGGYALLLLVMTVLLFGVPYLLFLAL